ncbi:tetratricopeptide repeat protein [Pseudomonas koreensis]|uniref:tetratricopeptide repeat protein n=1 Tax=Pseudomonas koreensis TaxID=198620 RepID=UPI00320A2003
MASLKWVLMIGSFFSAANVFAVDPPILGVAGNTVTFQAKSWTLPVVESTTAWFTANGQTFPLFHAGIGAQAYLNLADSYWAVNDKERAVAAYKQYVSRMSEAGKASKIPARVGERRALAPEA